MFVCKVEFAFALEEGMWVHVHIIEKYLGLGCVFWGVTWWACIQNVEHSRYLEPVQQESIAGESFTSYMRNMDNNKRHWNCVNKFTTRRYFVEFCYFWIICKGGMRHGRR
jgi:hypothetical protein